MNSNSSVGEIQPDKCIVCQDDKEEKFVDITLKGMKTLKEYSRKRTATYMTDFLETLGDRCSAIKVHQSCRRNFTDPKRLKVVPAQKKKKSLRRDSSFEWKSHCFICTLPALIDHRHLDRSDVQQVRILAIRNRIIEICNKRHDDETNQLRGRLEGCIDLPAVEAVYHKKCYQNFLKPNQEKKPVGRPPCPEFSEIFENFCYWYENIGNTELLTLTEVQEKIREMSPDINTYSDKYIKMKLQERYGDHIFFAEVNGRKNVMCFKNMASYIVNEKWLRNREEDIEKESQRIVSTAAKLIREEIRNIVLQTDVYPEPLDMKESLSESSVWNPPLLKLLLSKVVPNDIQQCFISQCIIKAARPRSALPPLLFGLGAECDHVFGSKWLIDELFKYGLSVSYTEVTRYKQSVLSDMKADQTQIKKFPKVVTQFIADNVDHNLHTLDGKGTFHGMGIIAVSTPLSSDNAQPEKMLVQRKQYITSKALTLNKGIPIVSYLNENKVGLSNLKLKPIENLLSNEKRENRFRDLAWNTSWLFNCKSNPKTNWSGYMQNMSDGPYPGQSHIIYLPIIDLNPNDEKCIYSTLLFIQQQSKLLNIETPVITFDQPLWLKATDIIHSKKLGIVCRLGGFHLLMSFLGSIGKLMEKSGIEEALENIYGSNAVTHILSGKAYARSIRGHFLLQAALYTILLKMITPDDESSEIPLFQIDETIDVTNIDNFEAIKQCEMNIFRDQQFNLEDDQVQHVLKKLGSNFLLLKGILCSKSRTAKLWNEYIRYVEIVKDFIRAERTGDWLQHLQTVRRMLNLFAATGHNNYAKSARLYLQSMEELHESYPALHDLFLNGYHTIRRSNRYWAGLSTDLVIEQTLMRSLKSRGGVTRGRGLSEAVRLLWVHSSHKFAAIHETMTDISTSKSHYNFPHKDLGSSTKERDCEDFMKLIHWFTEHSPFNPLDPNLRSISSGRTSIKGKDDVNCEDAEEIGSLIQRSLDNKCFTEVCFSRKNV